VKAKRAKPARVYPAESDPRQVKLCVKCGGTGERHHDGAVCKHCVWWPDGTYREPPGFAVCTPENARTLTIDPEILAREFGPWVKAEDGSWFRDRSKRRRKR